MKNKTLWGAAALAVASAFVGGNASAQVATSWSSGAPRTSEEDRQFRVNGRLMMDLYSLDADFPGTSADENYTRTFERRAYLGVEGRFTQNWRYNFKVELQDGVTGFDDAFLEYAGSNYSLYIGNNNAVSPLEDRTSSTNIPFNERSALYNAFGYGRRMGVAFLTNGGNWSIGASLAGDSLNTSETVNQDEATAVAVRGTWAPVYANTPDGTRLIHLGASARYRDNGGGPTNVGSGIGFNARPNTGTGTRFIDTGSAFQQDVSLGVEVAGQYDAFGFTAEYGQVDADPLSAVATASLSNGTRTFSGGYVDLFWSPTGESRRYNAADGSFGRVQARRTFGSDGGIGHVMLGLRYDWLDLTDGAQGAHASIDGGEQTSWTAGVHWQPINNVIVRLNYSMLDIDRPNSTASGDADTITLRTQIDW